MESVRLTRADVLERGDLDLVLERSFSVYYCIDIEKLA